jgi:F420-dependent oxidoreductase-like protein|tara:strand:+ start:808 stop:1719 length:912 start_codon:yes stop_codon:yes gene_type:complete
MQFGAQLSNYGTQWSDIATTVHALESGRWNSVWFSDHFMPPGRPEAADGPALEGWTLITAVAAITHRLRLGVLATGNTYRNPALLAKMCSTLDHISEGRMELGIGAAWYEHEHNTYGWGFPSLKERSDRLEEAVDLIRMLFTRSEGERVDFSGKYYQVNDAPLSPGSTQSPHIPILIGGNGEKRTLRTCAKSGDIFNLDFWHPGGVDVFAHKAEVVIRHCESFDRDPKEIKRTVCLPFRLFETEEKFKSSNGMPWYCWGTASRIQDLLAEYIEAGAQEIMLCSVPNKPEAWQRIDEDVLSAFD